MILITFRTGAGDVILCIEMLIEPKYASCFQRGAWDQPFQVFLYPRSCRRHGSRNKPRVVKSCITGAQICSPSTTMSSSPSEFSENVSDSETLAPIMTCIEDDKEFIRNARARTMVDVGGRRMIKGGQRVALLWRALHHLTSSLQKRVFLQLLQGSDDREDIWLWKEGDGALLEWNEDSEDSPPPWTAAATALERRLAQTPAQTLQGREVQRATFGMRAAMIVWLALTSAAYKSAGEECGVRDREEWDMGGLIWVWYWGLPYRVREWLFQQSRSYDDRAFTGAMDQAGHSCHQTRGQVNSCWLFMRSELLPAQQDHIIYLRGEHCAPCLAHKPIPGPESPPSWTPSRALVALRFIWDSTADSRDFSKWLSDQPIYRLTEVNDLFNSLPRNIDEDRYLSWVNAYPRWLGYTVTQYTLKEWEAMDDCLTGSERGGSLNIRSWCAAMFWRMMPPGLSHSTWVARLIDPWCYTDLQSWDFLPPAAPAPEFRDTIRESGHTCWKEWEMDDYAAAMDFLKEDPKVVGIDLRKDSECQVCELQWRLRSLGKTLPVEEQAFEVDLTKLLFSLRTECSRRKVAWNDIVTYVEEEFVSGDDSLDGIEESEDGDEGSDDDESSEEDERAPVAAIHPSQDKTTTSHGENNPNSGVVCSEKVVDLYEDSAAVTGRVNFTNLLSENPHPYSTGPVNFGEAIIHGRQIHDSQQINALSTNSGGLQGLYAGSDRLFRHMYLDPPSPQHIQNGTPFPWLQNFSGSGSDPMVGQQWEYIEDRTATPNFHEGLSQLPHLDNSQFKMNSRAVEHSDTNTTLHPISLSNQRESLWQNAGDYATTEPSAATYPTGNLVRSQIPSAIDIGQNLFPSRNTPHINSQSHTSSTVVATGKHSRPDKGPMAQYIKKHITDGMVRVGIPLSKTKDGEFKLPWRQFKTMLDDNGVEMINWPDGVPQPGEHLGTNSGKGFEGVKYDLLKQIYDAIQAAPIRFVREETVPSSGLYTMSGDPETSLSRKRTRDSGDHEHEMSQPERGGKRMYFQS
ncbi:hypothetical protein C8J56DRAFT_105332 [Mycena floridula]|nr:hypothetical protein C8J56DRAFT_105332 [Mycena floridula]